MLFRVGLGFVQVLFRVKLGFHQGLCEGWFRVSVVFLGGGYFVLVWVLWMVALRFPWVWFRVELCCGQGLFVLGLI